MRRPILRVGVAALALAATAALAGCGQGGNVVSVKVEPSETMYCSVCTLVASTVGQYVSDNAPSATVNHTLEVVLRAVPTQSLRARSK